MRPITTVVTGVGTSDPVVLDTNKNPFNIGIGVVPSGAATYTVQYSFDGDNWFDHPALTAKTTKAESNIAFPVLHTRLNVTASDGTVTMTTIQAGIA